MRVLYIHFHREIRKIIPELYMLPFVIWSTDCMLEIFICPVLYVCENFQLEHTIVAS